MNIENKIQIYVNTMSSFSRRQLHVADGADARRPTLRIVGSIIAWDGCFHPMGVVGSPDSLESGSCSSIALSPNRSPWCDSVLSHIVIFNNDAVAVFHHLAVGLVCSVGC